MGRCPYCYLFSHRNLPMLSLCITMAKSLVNYRIYMAINRWHSIDAHFNVLSIQHLLPSICVFMVFWLYRLSFCMIETRPCGKAERRNHVAVFTLTWLKIMNHAKRFIAPAIHLFMNRYPQHTSYNSPRIHVELKLFVKLHIAGEPMTHPVLLFLPSIISPRFNCIDHHQHLLRFSIWLPCQPNQAGRVGRSAHILLLRAFRIFDAIVVLYIGFLDHIVILFTVVWIIQVTIPAKPIFDVRNAFRCVIIVAFDWTTVDPSNGPDIYHSSSSSRVVICRASWWQRWSFWQFKCSHTMRLKEWPECFDDLFCVRNVSSGCHMLVFSARFLLGST